MQRKFIKRNTFVFLGVVFALILSLSLCFMPTVLNVTSSAETIYDSTFNPADISLTVTAYNKLGEPLTATSSAITIHDDLYDDNAGYPLNSYNWKDVKYFKVTMTDKNNLDDVVNENDKYNYTYSVIFIPTLPEYGEINVTNASRQTVAFIEEAPATKAGVIDEFYFFIDNNMQTYKTSSMTNAYNAGNIFEEKEDFSYNVQGGWGTYLFCFESQNHRAYSSLAEIKPTSLESIKNEAMTVEFKEVSSGQSINSAYLFTVNEQFQYVRRNNISWKISGTATDGTKYVLRPADITAENELTLYTNDNAINPKGVSFKLDTQIQGKWTATATITEGTLVKTATSEEVSTIKPFSTEAIIWISVGVAGAAVIAVTIIILVNIRKERTW